MSRYVIILLICLTACTANEPARFTKMDAAKTGIKFSNRPDSSLHLLDYLYYYNGGGVAAGDIDNDGLIDLYFTGNANGANRLYKNLGDFRFEDITETAGVSGTAGWHTGTTMVDINGDGLLDIYVCAVTGKHGLTGRNQLYINQGNGSFQEQARQYNLDFEGYSTQAAFFDYDKDGDLDCYLLNQSDHSVERIGDTTLRKTVRAASGDRLYRNDNGRFTDVTVEAGIYTSVLGYGLGIAIADINGDGWNDIYIGNDFQENDYYYRNTGRGSFVEEGSMVFRHYSRFSMGNDIADYNNDGEPDIITADMLPEQERFLKTYSSGESIDLYRFLIERNGFQHQYSRNSVQRNLGKGEAFSEIGLQLGVAATDWSWSPLFADFNNDGWKDIFISNGIRHRPVDMDFMRFITDNNVQKRLGQTKALDQIAINQMPDGAAANYLFISNGGTNFEKAQDRSAYFQPDYATGAVYADLNNDGQIDLVTNNSFAEAGIYKNNNKGGHWLHCSLKDTGSNSMSIGAKIWLWQGGQMQYQQLHITRGFQSSVAPRIYFGLQNAQPVDSLLIQWPGGQFQQLRDVAIDQHIIINRNFNYHEQPAVASAAPLFTNITSNFAINWRHQENQYTDFSRQKLIPHELSKSGPKIAAAPATTSTQWVYVNGAKGQHGLLLHANHAGELEQVANPFTHSPLADETGAAWLDADGNGLPDLFISTGGNEYQNGNPALENFLYMQTQPNQFERSTKLPLIYNNAGAVAAFDADSDGDTDLFIGTLTNGITYGEPCSSYLLLNDGKGNFTEANERILNLSKIGMVTSATAADLNGDGLTDLIIAGEWMPITIFQQTTGGFKKHVLENTEGWWQCLQTGDVNGDQLPDIIAGNYGWNSKLTASERYPLRLYLTDIDKNGETDPLLTYSSQSGEYPFLGKDELEQQIPMLKKRFLYFRDFAGKTITEIFPTELVNTKPLTVKTLSSSLFINKGDFKFDIQPLPQEAQYAPLFGILTEDLNTDQKPDLVTAGNFYGTSPFEGRYDANWGFAFVHLDGSTWNLISPAQSGMLLRGEFRDLKSITVGTKRYVLAAQNSGPLLLFSINRN